MLGVYAISAILLTAAGALVTLALGTRTARVWALAVLVLPWLAGMGLSRIEWTHATSNPIGVAVIQGAIPQDQKWLDANRDTTLNLYRELTVKALGTPLIVWPESAPPDIINNLVDYLMQVGGMANERGSALVMGIVREADNGEDYYNSVIAFAPPHLQSYDKTHLVPFAEFFPVPEFVREFLRLRNLPNEDFTRGADNQPPLAAAAGFG